MSLYLDGTVDPVAALGKRQLDTMPWHFHVIPVGQNSYYLDADLIRNWIWRNMSGRFFVGTRTRSVDGKLTSDFIAAFEESSEAIMFSFVAPTLKNDGVDVFV